MRPSCAPEQTAPERTATNNVMQRKSRTKTDNNPLDNKLTTLTENVPLSLRKAGLTLAHKHAKHETKTTCLNRPGNPCPPLLEGMVRTKHGNIAD